MASYSPSLITKPLSLSKYMLVCLGLMLLLVVGFFNPSSIFFTSTFLILCTAYFTLFVSQNPNFCKPNHKKEEEVSERLADIIRDECITSNEDEGYQGCGNVSKISFLSRDDGYISDEDALIEIELPTGHYLSPYEDQLEQDKINIKQNLVTDYYSCKMHHQQSWMELLSEEDNLIEIDISIGCIMS